MRPQYDFGFHAPPRRFRGLPAALEIGVTSFQCGPGRDQNTASTQTQATNTTDRRVGVDGDGAIVTGDVDGTFNLTTLADDVALGALDTADSLARVGGSTAVDLATQAFAALRSLVTSNEAIARTALTGAGNVSQNSLDAASNALTQSSANAALVANSQSQFLSTQTGQGTVQKTIGYAIAGGVVIALGLALANRKPK